ncbi:MAG TPA: carboxypeptidase-like regulatory domain-containing protein, partial [Flavisolibacter sp.]|nr:carboxypeptidase-like regulatory domain-containing protein [Flavisolibacter sp.]
MSEEQQGIVGFSIKKRDGSIFFAWRRQYFYAASHLTFMHMKIDRLLALVLLFCSSIAFGQNATEKLVKGIVKDETGALLPGITVTEKGTSNAAATNGQGVYSIRVKSDAVLVFTGVGFTREEVAVSGNSEVNVALSGESKALS